MSSQAINLTLEKREITGKAVKKLRREGIVPAVIHDHGKDSIVVNGSFIDITKVYQQAGKHHPVNLIADGKKYLALIKQVDLDPKKNQIRHVVFNAIKANEKVEAEIPVRIEYAEGNDATPAERAGLVVLNQLELVEVSALPGDLPDVLTFDGEKLVEVGDQATVADLKVPAGVVIKTESTQSLATVFEPSALQAANDAAGGDAEEEEAPGEEAADSEESAEESSEEKASGDAKLADDKKDDGNKAE